MENFLTQKSYLIGIHRYAFRSGEAAEIIGVKYVKLENHDWRLTYEIQYFDGKIDYVSYLDVSYGNYVIMSDIDLANEKMNNLVNGNINDLLK